MAGIPQPPGQTPQPGAPPPGPMPGMPGMPPQAPPVGAPPPFGGGLGPAQASLQDALMQDVSDKMSHAFQILDLSQRFMEQALGTGQLYQQPDVLAHIRAMSNDLKKIITKYAKSSDSEIPSSEDAGPDSATAGDVEDMHSEE